MNPRRRTLFTLPPAAARDPFDDITAQEIGSAIGRNIDGAINAVVDMRRAAAQASAEIDVARRAYWEAVRTGRGVDAAKARFRDALDGKDLVYMMLAVPEGASGPRTIAINAISGGIDGGIQAFARNDFINWIQAVFRGSGVPSEQSELPRRDAGGSTRDACAPRTGESRSAGPHLLCCTGFGGIRRNGSGKPPPPWLGGVENHRDHKDVAYATSLWRLGFRGELSTIIPVIL